MPYNSPCIPESHGIDLLSGGIVFNGVLYKICYTDNDRTIGCAPIKYLYSESGEPEPGFPDDYARGGFMPCAHIPDEASHILLTAYRGGFDNVEERLIGITAERTPLPEKPKARIAVISDLHTIQKGRSRRLLFEAFESVAEQGAELVISAGDNVNGCQAGEFEILKSSVDAHLGGLPFYPALGNHDYFSNHKEDIPDEEARAAFIAGFTAQSGATGSFLPRVYSVRHNGIHIIFLDCVRNSRSFRFESDLAEWLRSELEKSSADRLRIVVNHIPLPTHNLGCYKKERNFMAGGGKLQKLLDEAGRAVYISGHTHNRLDSDFPSAERDGNGNIYINAGSVGNTQPCVKDMKNLKKLRNALTKDDLLYGELDGFFRMASMGLFLDVYEDKLAVRGFDFSRKLFIPRCSFVFEL